MQRILHSLLLLLLPVSVLSKPEDHPIFTLHDITYSSSEIYSTPAHLAVADGYIAFNLTSTAVPYTTHCSATGNQLQNFFYGNIMYHCDVLTGAGAGVVSNFTFSEPNGEFSVNQTWSCGDEYANKTYLGYGTGNVNLTCETDFWQNTNWTEGQLYSTLTTTCEPTNLTIIPTVIN